jgi:hypothetical protein
MSRKKLRLDRRPRFFLEIQPTVVVSFLEKFGSLSILVSFSADGDMPSSLREQQASWLLPRQSGRRRRAAALASVRRSNCTSRFPAYSFHKDAHKRKGEPREGIREMRFTKPNSSYSFTLGNSVQPRLRHRQNRCDQMRRTIQPSSWWKRVRTWARL